MTTFAWTFLVSNRSLSVSFWKSFNNCLNTLRNRSTAFMKTVKNDLLSGNAVTLLNETKAEEYYKFKSNNLVNYWSLNFQIDGHLFFFLLNRKEWRGKNLNIYIFVQRITSFLLFVVQKEKIFYDKTTITTQLLIK